MGIVRAITDLVTVVALLVVVEVAVVVVMVEVCHVVLEEDWAKMRLNEPGRQS